MHRDDYLDDESDSSFRCWHHQFNTIHAFWLAFFKSYLVHIRFWLLLTLISVGNRLSSRIRPWPPMKPPPSVSTWLLPHTPRVTWWYDVTIRQAYVLAGLAGEDENRHADQTHTSWIYPWSYQLQNANFVSTGIPCSWRTASSSRPTYLDYCGYPSLLYLSFPTPLPLQWWFTIF